MGVGDDSAEAVVSSNGAVVGALWSRVAIVGPAQRPSRELGLCAHQRVLLLDAEPGLFFRAGVEDFLGVNSEVCICWLERLAGAVCPVVSFGHDDDVVSLSEWVSEECYGLHDDFRVVSGGLVTGRSVVVPLGNVGEGFDFFDVKSAALGTESDAATVDPNILSNNAVADFFPAARVVYVLVVE